MERIMRKPHRSPKTTQECRLSIYNFEEHYFKIRAKRNKRNLVNSYSDLMRSNDKIRSWKKHRLTQYKS